MLMEEIRPSPPGGVFLALVKTGNFDKVPGVVPGVFSMTILCLYVCILQLRSHPSFFVRLGPVERGVSHIVMLLVYTNERKQEWVYTRSF